jgi:hypothetical protein
LDCSRSLHLPICHPDRGRGEHEASAGLRERRARRSDEVAEPGTKSEWRDKAFGERKRARAA